MPALNADTAYGPALVATALTSTALFIISATVLGTAIARTHRRLRWHGIAYEVKLGPTRDGPVRRIAITSRCAARCGSQVPPLEQ